MALETLSLLIQGMTCDDCARTVERGLAKQAGIAHVQVSRASGTAEVAYDPTATTVEDILMTAVFTKARGAYRFRARLMPACC